jgi:hypothetical protein
MSEDETSRRGFLGTIPVTALGVAGITGSAEAISTAAETQRDVPNSRSSSQSGPTIFEQVRLAPDDGKSNDRFGSSVTVSDDGRTALVGAPYADEQTGAVYVFEKGADGWQESTRLTGSLSDTEDLFGHSVALAGDGTIALVGAMWDDDPYGHRAGAAYVFEKVNGSWQEQTNLAADDGISRDEFGTSVALSDDGTIALIGANSDGNKVGAAYVYQQTEGTWTQQQKLTARDSDELDKFGTSVSLSDDGETGLISATGDESLAGSVYIFEDVGGNWSQQQKFAPEDVVEDDMFGYSTALSDDGTTALVGARQVEKENGDEVGAAYVFKKTNDEWQQRGSFTSEDGDSYDYFGSAVSLTADGTEAAIGAYRDEDPQGYYAGSAYSFTQGAEGWNQAAKLTPTRGNQEDRFGYSTAMSADGATVLIGAHRDENDNGTNAGSVYVFERTEITVSDYADSESGIVESGGLQQAIEDMQADTIGVDLLTQIIDAWHNRDEVA